MKPTGTWSWIAIAAASLLACSNPARQQPPGGAVAEIAPPGDPPAGSGTRDAGPGSPPTDTDQAPGTPRPLPARLSVVVDAATDAGPRFVNMELDIGSGLPWTITGCTSTLRQGCDKTLLVELSEAQRVELVQRLVAVQASGCHDVLGAGGTLSISVGLVYDGPCGADADLAWWMVEQFDPAAMHR